MNKRYFLLGPGDGNRVIRLIRIAFGVLCIAVAIYWLNYNFRALKTDWTLWITIIFLAGFGLFQIWSGLGRATRFIEIDNSSILLKKNSILSPVLIAAPDVERIEIFPLNIIFYIKSKKRILLRFGTSYHDQNELILDELISFAESNKIPFEIIEEKL